MIGGRSYGDNASGGVVNIITKDGGEAETNLEISLGSFETGRLSVGTGGREKDLSYTVSAVYLDTDGYRKNSDMEAEDLGVKLNYDVNDYTLFKLSSGFHRDKAGIPGTLQRSDLEAGMHRTSTKTPDDYNEVEDYYFFGGPEMYFWHDSVFSLKASYRKRKSFGRFSIGGGYFEGDTEITTQGVSPQLVINNDFGGTGNTLTLGLDREDVVEHIVNDSTFAGINAYRLEKENRSFYLHDQAEWGENWNLSAGYRHDRTRYRFNPGLIEEDKDLYTFGVTYRFSPTSSVYAGYSKSFRYPALDEYYSFFFNTLDQTLRPQVSGDYELGVRHRFDETFSAGIAFFRIDTMDEIFSDPAVFTSENLDGKTRRTGLEMSVVKTVGTYTVSGNYTWIKAVIKDGIRSGKDIPNVPRHRLSADVSRAVGSGTTLTVNGQYVGKRPFISDFNNDFADQPAYTVLSARIRFERDRGSFFMDINNITDVEYSGYALIDGGQEAYSPSPKFNVTVGFTRKF